MKSASMMWIDLLAGIMKDGVIVSPRGKLTKEIPQNTISMDMRYPVLLVKNRKLNYQFMAAEAFWILSGDDKVEGIVPWNKHIAEFSDDGKTFFGAYGPMIVNQLNYVVNKLLQDTDTRQAGLTIWRMNPPQTKDVPCTISMFFNIRSGLLNCHVFMRSSDAWLGIPYDIFNFSMVAHMVCAMYNIIDNIDADEAREVLTPGTLYITAASSHIYEQNMVAVGDILAHAELGGMIDNQTPELLYLSRYSLLQWLKELRDSKPGNERRWWERKA